MVTKQEKSNTYTGLSTDTKPLDVNNGSIFMEIDTGTSYIFDAANEEWIELSASSSGGSGSSSGLPEVSASDNGDVLTVVEGAWAKAAPSGGGVLVVNVDTSTGTLDKTWQEIHDAPIAVVHSTNEACPSEVIVGCPTGYNFDPELGEYVPEYYVRTYADEWVQDGYSGYVEEVHRNYYTFSTDGFPVLINYGG